MIWALASGTIGSSLPAAIKAGCHTAFSEAWADRNLDELAQR
jgi:hypothetical protein